MATFQHIFFMAVVRMNNNSKLVLAKYGSDQYIAKLEAFLSQPKFNSFMAENMGKRNGWANPNEGYKVCLYGERDLIVIAFTSMKVPEGVAYSGLIADTMAQFEQAFRGKWQDAAENAFTSKFKKTFARLFKEYDKIEEKSKIAKLTKEVEAVTNVMSGNIAKALENLNETSKLQKSTTRLAENAEKFNKKAKAVKCHQMVQGWKLKGMIFLIFVIVILVVLAAAGVFDNPGTEGGDTPTVKEAPTPARRLESWEVDWN